MKIRDLQKKIADAFVVMTPTFTRNGSRTDGLPVEAQLTIQCVEVPEHNRLQSRRLTTLDAAEIEDFFSNTSKLEYLRSISFEKYDENVIYPS